MLEDTVGAEDVEDDKHNYDTDEELIFDDWYAGRAGICRGEAEAVLGKQWFQRNPVNWAIDTCSGW